MTYPRTTWVNGSTGLGATNMNNIEKYLVMLPIISRFGPYTITTTPTFFNHNLVDQNGTAIIPDLVFIQVSGVSTNVYVVEFDIATMTTTQVKLTSNINSPTVYGIALKF